MIDVATLYEQHGAALRSYVHSRMLGAAEPDADDVYATVWERVVRASGSYRELERSKSWLYRIATNLIRDYYRSGNWKLRGPSVRTETLLDEHHPITTDRYPSDDEHVRAAVEMLKADQRDVVLLRYWEDRTFAETGALLGVTQTAAKKRIERAWANLGRMLVEAA